MFDGRATSRTKISMRGKSREESKSEFLRRARDERQARELRENTRTDRVPLWARTPSTLSAKGAELLEKTYAANPGLREAAKVDPLDPVWW